MTNLREPGEGKRHALGHEFDPHIHERGAPAGNCHSGDDLFTDCGLSFRLGPIVFSLAGWDAAAMRSKPDQARRLIALGLAAGLGALAIPLPGAAPRAEPPAPLALTGDVAESIQRLEHLAGRPMPTLDNRIVIVSFFASWCAPCIDEFAYLGSIYNAYGSEDPAIVAINLYDSWGGENHAERLRRFIDRTEPLFTVVRGDDEIAHAFGGVKEIPSLFVFGRDGQLAYRFLNRPEDAISESTEAQLHAVLNKLL